MAQNDKILLDGIIKSRVDDNNPSNKRDEVFEFLSYEEILKDYDLSKDELLSGSVDGPNDGGIDAIFIFVNGILYDGEPDFSWPKSSGELIIYFISCKCEKSFAQGPINNMIPTFEQLLNSAIPEKDLLKSYNEDLLAKRKAIFDAYKNIAPSLSTFKIEIVYSASAPSENLSSNITDRIALLTNICKKYFSNCVANFTFWGDAKICQAYYKRKKTTLSLNFQTSLMQGEQYVLLVKLSDYYNFLKDDDGKLRFYLFDSNVRAFMGLNSVNTDILASLNRQDGPDFWWLNNGITILGDSVTIAGYAMSITNVQIVNGLQTSQCIFTHFANGNVDDPRFVLIKVLTNKDASVRDSIIRATNNQTNVEIASLRATDKIQRDIEEELKQQGLYYERRTNFYADQGISPEKIFNLLFLASGYVALILKNPDKAVRLRNRFTRDPKEYQAIFSEKTDLRIWPKIATLLRRTEEQLIKERTTQTGNLDSFLKSSRYLVSYLTLSRLLKKFDYGVDDFLAFDVSSFSLEEIHQTWVDLSRYLTKSWDKRCWRKPSFVSSVIQIESLRLGMALPASQKNRASSFSKKIDLSDSFVDLVKSALPPQPWPEKVVVTVATQLKVKPEKVIAAINKLIEKGDVYLQLNGHLFDQKGNEIIPS